MSKNLKICTGILSLALFSIAPVAMAQDTTTNNNAQTQTQTQTQTQARTISSGQKVKLQGVVTERNGNTLTVREINGATTQVMIGDATSIKSKKFFGSGKTYAADLVTRGLFIEAEGRGDQSGSLVANKIRFGEDDLRAAQSLEARVNPVEGRLTEAEQNAQRLSGQLDELVAISNAARGGAKAAQDTADAAVAGVNATNQRITELDDFVVQNNVAVNFKLGSATLSTEAKAQIDQIAQGLQAAKGYVVEVTGYADASGSAARNRALSERRAQAVISYLVENHGVPLRRILPSYGFGEIETKAVADNTTREGRAQNRRVEVKLLVSRGLNQTVNVANPNNTTEPQQ